MYKSQTCRAIISDNLGGPDSIRWKASRITAKTSLIKNKFHLWIIFPFMPKNSSLVYGFWICLANPYKCSKQFLSTKFLIRISCWYCFSVEPLKTLHYPAFKRRRPGIWGKTAVNRWFPGRQATFCLPTWIFKLSLNLWNSSRRKNTQRILKK